MFELHPRLMEDTFLVGHMELSVVLLHKDSQFPWVILVPQQPEVTEIHHLELADRHQLMNESCRIAEIMVDLFAPHKMNIAAIGNLVPQLHLHHVARFVDDVAWPQPVWGREMVPYAQGVLEERLERIRHAMEGEGFRPAV